VSLLTSVTVEGRCPGPTFEDADCCRRRAATPSRPTTLGYQHVTQNADLPGYEGFDETLHHLAGSPSYSLDGKQADLFDINSDGLPDVLVTLPGFFQGQHGLFLNGGNGPGSFAASTISVTGVLGATATDITLANADVTPQTRRGRRDRSPPHAVVKTYASTPPSSCPAAGRGWTRDHDSGRADPKVDFTTTTPTSR